MKRTAVLLGLALALFSFIFTACKDDKNPVAVNEFGEISGTVNFVGAWPAAGDVQVSIWSSWPPAGPPAAASDALTSNNNSATYKLDGLQKGTYPVMTVGWRDPQNPTGAKVIGIYWAQSDSLGVDASGNVTAAPQAIVIDNSQMVYSNVVVKANLDIIK
ncbi:MAG: hypothetical protein H6695_00785 [Deferribacteres bacterium]|nr:hypothetical protein [candidate division KSB1 bacterium]MCB9508685.1 hypothetical protein [Deferribacteres bacterium]